MNPAPVYFIAHGGPTMIENTQHPAYQHWLQIFNEIKQNSFIRAICFISAHWQADSRLVGSDVQAVMMNIDQTPRLFYDYDNFPDRFYQLQFPTTNPPWLSTLVAKTLQDHRVNVIPVNRGIDHGIFVPLIVGYGQEAKRFPPMIQISLPAKDEDGDAVNDGLRALRLGKALQLLRLQGIAVIGGGQTVHNLIDFRRKRMNIVTPTPYSKPFLSAVSIAMTMGDQGVDQTSKEPKRWQAVLKLLTSPFFHQAHPSSEHFLPLLVCLGAAFEHEQGQEGFVLDEGALGWNMYQWGLLTGTTKSGSK